MRAHIQQQQRKKTIRINILAHMRKVPLQLQRSDNTHTHPHAHRSLTKLSLPFLVMLEARVGPSRQARRPVETESPVWSGMGGFVFSLSLYPSLCPFPLLSIEWNNLNFCAPAGPQPRFIKAFFRPVGGFFVYLNELQRHFVCECAYIP